MASRGTLLSYSPLFWLGFCFKALFILFYIPQIQQKYFIPFLQNFLFHPSIDPWQSFLSHGGNFLAFPYGIGMIIFFLPALLLHLFLGVFFKNPPLSLSIGVTFLSLDYLLFSLLSHFSKEAKEKLTFFYWLSPFLSFICFIHGQLDLIPTMLLVIAIYFLQKQKPYAAGIVLAWTMSAKLNTTLAIPFFLIFLWRSPQYRPLLLPTFTAFSLMLFPFFLHAIFSPSFQQMVLNSPEILKIYSLKISFADNRNVYIVFVAYLLTLYTAWFLRRMNIPILFTFLGIAFSSILLLTDASIGWYIWLIPSLTLHYVRSSFLVRSLLLLHTFTLALWGAINEEKVVALIPSNILSSMTPISSLINPLFLSLLFSLQIIIAVHMAISGIKENDYFILSRKPLSIAIAGDSGVGKDTLAQSLKQLFAARSTTTLSGDNYHRWDRRSLLWKYTTHLQFNANKLQEYSTHALHLIKGRSILSPQYDHTTGRFLKSFFVRQNDIVLLSGLHAFLSPILRESIDLRIYMEMDEELRRTLKLKRDMKERRQSKEKILAMIEKRQEDKKFIAPQKKWADLIFKILPQKNSQNGISPLQIQVTTKNAIYTENISRGLIGICGLSVQVEEEFEENTASFHIQGLPKKEELSSLLSLLAPQMKEWLSLSPKWEDGITGLMQLFCLVHLQQKLSFRKK